MQDLRISAGSDGPSADPEDDNPDGIHPEDLGEDGPADADGDPPEVDVHGAANGPEGRPHGKRSPDVIFWRDGTGWQAHLSLPVGHLGSARFPRGLLVKRDEDLLRLASVIAQEQAAFLTSGDRLDLVLLDTARLRTLTGWNRDRASRLLDGKVAGVPGGRTMDLAALAPGIDEVRMYRLIRLLRERDVVDRDGAGRATRIGLLVTTTDMAAALAKTFGKGRTTRNLERVLGKLRIPADPKRRAGAYLNGEDWWTTSP